MSEKTIVELKEEDRKLLRSVIEATKLRDISTEKTEHVHEEPKHEHFAVNMDYLGKEDSCPDCVAGLKKFGSEFMKKTLEERSKLPYICKDCGIGVKDEEEECPNCGGKDAEER